MENYMFMNRDFVPKMEDLTSIKITIEIVKKIPKIGLGLDDRPKKQPKKLSRSPWGPTNESKMVSWVKSLKKNRPLRY